MSKCEEFFNSLLKNDIDFFTGVPDSLLKDFCAYITDNTNEKNNIITANEGNAIALATGHYLATGKFGLVYMQNSGLGNTINPITSLVDSDVYSIPILLIIGWRGEPGVKDEPQHIKMGKITLKILETLEVSKTIKKQIKIEFLVKTSVFIYLTSKNINFILNPKFLKIGVFRYFRS